MTKIQMVNAIFEGTNSLYEYQLRDIIKLSKERIEYAYEVYTLLVVQMHDKCSQHLELIKKYLFGSIY